MRTILKSTVVALFSVAVTVSSFGGDQLYDFNVGGNPPSGDPTSVPGFVLYGNHAGSAYQFSDGNPVSGGYLQLTDAAGSENCGILFPDVDLYTNSLGQVVSLPVKAFTITMDVRAGNGTRRPADGFSINFVRQNDPALERALRPTPLFAGWAGGDSLAATADLGDTGNPESGTHTGLSVCFDTWAGNWLPVNGVITNSAAANDIEGVYIRLDDVTIDSNPFTANAATRNGGCYITELNPADPCGPTVVTNGLTLQTGPWTGPSANTGDGGVSDGTYTSLGWAPLSMEVNEAKQVTVVYKGRVLLDHLQLTNYPTSQGRLILACRTGGSWEHTHIDNVRLLTTAAVQPVFQNVTGSTNGFQINILDIAAAQTTNLPFVSLDGVDVTSQVVSSNNLDVSFHGVYTQAVRFLPKSTHTVVVHLQDALGQRFTNTANFTVPPWIVLDPSTAVALAQVDTTKPGFRVKSYQGLRYQPNQLRWTEEQVIGIRGPNVADQTAAVGGFFGYGDVPKFSNGGGGTLFTNPVTPFTIFGIGNGNPPTPASATDSAVEIFSYLYFPAAGTYVMYVGSDDGFRLSFAANPLDRMGVVANEFDGGRGLGEPGDQVLISVAQPGCYPVRMLWENGTGPDNSNGANLQWFTGSDTNTYALINDTNNPNAILAYQDVLPAASLGAYVKRANPVRDAQNVVFYQPILVELGNGTGTRTVNQGSIVLAVDGTNQNLTITSPDASTTRVVSQMGANVWSVGRHTNLLTFADNAGTNYSYTWAWTVINVQPSNTVSIPLASMVPAGSVDATKRGFRVKSYQSPHENPNHLSWTEQQLQGLHGPNVADQSLTGGNPYHTFGDVNDGAEGSGVLDLRNNNGGNGEWSYNTTRTLMEDAFGLGNNAWFTGTGFSAWRFNFAANKSESTALDFGTWLVFPAAGTYMIHANSDDGVKVLATTGNPFSKIGLTLVEANVGRGVAGPSGAQVGGDYRAISIPAAGAYPFRIVWENGGTGGGIEFSIYKVMPDGGVAKLPVNDLADPNSIKAYQTLTTGDTVAPYVSYANPPHNHQEASYWQPVVVELTDGPAPKGVNTSTIQLKVDGILRPVNLSSPSAGVTRIAQTSADWLPRVVATHTVELTYSDNGGASYTNTWPFTVMNLTPFVNNVPAVVVNVPASSAVPINTVDHNQPGFRVYAHQTAGADPGNVQQAEEQLLGLRGANIADLSFATNGLYFVQNDVVDFSDGYAHVPGITGYDTDSQNGEYRYNYAFQRFGFNAKGGGLNTNGTVLAFAGYMEFPTAGLYAMTVNSDDGFKISVPFANPRSQAGTILNWFNAGRGNTGGGGFGPRGSVTHAVFNIPAPGAYPIRLLWWNGGGGLNVEWTVYQFLPNGSVARTIVGDTNTPGAIKVYQESSQSGPFITSMSPAIPYQLVVNGAQVTRLNRGQDMVINLQDGNTTVDTANVTLTIGGIVQPIVITQPSAGVTTVTRVGTNALPAGFYGPAMFTYRDSASRTYTVNWTVLSSDFYGTVQGGYPVGSGDATKPGFLWRTYQVDGNGTTVLPTQVATAEQALAGIWTNNFANLSAAINGYFVLNGTGGNGSNGLINFNQDAPTAAANFSAANGYPDRQFPGLPGLVTPRPLDSVVGEATAYVEFPTNGTYVMGVSSDDGFRVTRGWGGANNNGALVVNSPASIAGQKPAVATSLFNTDTVSTPHTNVITGQIVQALGVGNGSVNAAEACAITNGALLNGKIALIYRGTCGFVAKVQNAAAAGAVAVVIVQDRPVNTPAEGWFPTEAAVNPMQPIPAIMIARKDGDAIVQALSNNTAVVNVTLKPITDIVNPPANSPVLGQASYGKGASDILFNVNVPAAGVYPMRLLWQEGGGGANAEWFSIDSTSGGRVLINDAGSTNGPGLKAFYGVTVLPTLTIQVSGGVATINYTGTLQSAPAVTGPWTDVYGQPPLAIPVSQAAMQFFRSR